MGYVDAAMPEIGSASLRSAFKALLDDGVDYGSYGIADNEKAKLIKNMWLRNGVLTTRKGLTDTHFDDLAGNIHSCAGSFGYEFVHSGDGLYCIDGNGCRLLYSGLPDENSFFTEFSGKLYLYCGTYVFSADRELNVVEEMPYFPVCEGKCNRETGLITYFERTEPNILAPVAKAYYNDVSVTDGKYHFPESFDASRKFCIFISDELVDESKYTFDERYFYLDKSILPGNEDTVSIGFYSTDSEIFKECGIIGSCSVGVAYGSGFADGTRVICAGNPDYCGKYFLSELSQPLYFKRDNYGIAGSGTEDIVAFSKQQSELLVFTKNSLHRMKYNYTADNGGYYSVHLVNSVVGCDMPGSIALCENRTVFANSTSGVFVVDSTDGFDVLNVLPLSVNINDCTGKMGFFSVDEEDRKNGDAVFYDRKYMLHMGDAVFILDLGKTGFSYGAGDDRRLAWFEFDGFKDVKHIFTEGGLLWALKTFDGGTRVYCLDGDDMGCVGVYRSADSDLGYPFNEKYVTAFRFGIVGDNSKFELCFYADGRKYAQINAVPVFEKDGFGYFTARLPKVSARHFAFEIKTENADAGIMNVGIDYILRKKINV